MVDWGSRTSRLLSVTACVCAEVVEVKTSTSSSRTVSPEGAGAAAVDGIAGVAGAAGAVEGAGAVSPKARMDRIARAAQVAAMRRIGWECRLLGCTPRTLDSPRNGNMPNR